MQKKEIAELFKTIADSLYRLSEIYSSDEESEQVKAESKKKQSAKTENVSEPAPVQETSENVSYTKEDVRAKLAQKAKADGGRYKADVKRIVAAFSSDGTLTGVPEDRYASLIRELEVVGDV